MSYKCNSIYVYSYLINGCILCIKKTHLWQQRNKFIFQNNNFLYYKRKEDNFSCRPSQIEKKGSINYFTSLAFFQCPVYGNLLAKAKSSLLSWRDPFEQCTLMLLSNLGEPVWISIPCAETFLYYVVCMKMVKPYKKNIHFTTSIDFKHCKRGQILLHNFCILFILNNFHLDLNYCEKAKGTSVKIFEFNQLHYIFDSISFSNDIPKIVLYDKRNSSFEIKVVWEFKKIKFRYQKLLSPKLGAIHICKYNFLEKTRHNGLIMCKNGGYILLTYVCDGVSDCPNDNSDETMCKCKSQNSNTLQSTHCVFHELQTKIFKCNVQYYMSKEGHCIPFIKQNTANQQLLKEYLIHQVYPEPENRMFHCNNGKIIDISLFDDLISDCGSEAEDEPLMKSIVLHPNGSSSCSPQEIPCMDGHIRCYSFSDICIFKLNQFNHLIPCRNGAHAENCKDFECNAMYKCIESYCISWTYVCDGKWDCPNGDDEYNNPVCGNQENCINMYKCKGSPTRCTEVSNTCNNVIDCIYADDEMFCELKNVFCPTFCRCILYSVLCNNMNFTEKVFLNFYSFISVNIFNSSFSIIHRNLGFPHFLTLPHNSIRMVCFLDILIKLVYLDVSFNLVQQIHANCFSIAIHLSKIILTNNKIKFLFPVSFADLNYLKFVDLSGNSITSMSSYSFLNLPKIAILNWTGVSHTTLELNIFHNIRHSLIIINTNHHLFCISPKYAIYTLYPPWYVSCSGILPYMHMKVLFALATIITCSINVFSIIQNVLKFASNKIFMSIIISINVSDCLLGIYFTIILISDISLGKTVFMSDKWKSHFLCLSAYTVLLWFTILSSLLQILLTSARLMVVLHPLGTKFKDAKFIRRSIFSIFCISFVISLLGLILFQMTRNSNLLDLCLPFLDPTNSIVSTKIITWFVVLLQTVSSVVISVMYALLFQKIKKSKNINENTKLHADFNLSIKLFATSFLIILCWFPINILYVSLMFFSSYSMNIVMWLLVIALPLNSITNPLISIIKTLKNKQK